VRRHVGLVTLTAALAALASGAAASAHSDPCHPRHSCPSDHHSYVWLDSAGRGWDCARAGAAEHVPARDRTTIVHDGHAYHCFQVGATAPRAVAAPRDSASVIARVVDGDTVDLTDGRRVRLVQIDTPEVFSGSECFGPQASLETKRLLPRGTRVKLVAEPATDAIDRYGRLLRYVVRAADGLNVNLRLVGDGAAAPYFYGGERGRYAGRLERLARRARAARRGLWGRCPSTPYEPYSAVSTRS
jgi:endonuclease YncB( thermonuclease family)